ncbi:hypothetical protein OG21DRAFT_640744 [Imleria badia]|nr:hypothetical protein OG21DRAFT_640744 [Imleria badia]
MVVPREGEGTTTRREWMCTFPVQYRDGPGPGHNGNVNQTVSISGFKIAVRDDLLGWMFQKPVVQPVPADGSGKGSDKNNISKQVCTENRGVDVNDVPALSQDPEALVAVTHDSEWITLIETGKLTPDELARRDRLEECLSENYSLVSQPENSAVYLQGKSKDVLSQPEVSWSTRPSVDNFQVVITRIRAEEVAAGFRRMPVGFYVLVQFDGTKWRTENKPVYLHNDVVEWDDRIHLPSDPSAKVQLSLCASFEFSPMLGNGESLRTVEICVGDLLDYTHVVKFSPTQGEPLSPCSSLLITTERQRSDKSGNAPDHDDHFDWEVSSDLARLTDQGHDTLLRFRDDPRKENVVASVEYFQHALSSCSKDDGRYAAALCNLARAQFIQCQIDRSVELSTTISYCREALELRPVGHPDRPGTLLLLADVLLYHRGKLGFEEFPREIVALASQVQASCSEDSHERRAADLALQTYALYKAISSGSLPDIDESILGLRQAVHDIPQYYFDKLQRLTNLSLALWIRYEIYGDLGNLDESIAIHEKAMQFIPCGLDSPTHTQLLKERANATLTSFSWKDALVTAAGFVVPRFVIYRITCERLETIGRITDASECLQQMVDELVEQANAHDKQVQWVLRKLEGFGDASLSAGQHDDAISLFSVALSFNPAALQGLLRKRSKAYVAGGLWEKALSDANKMIVLDRSSPCGYEMKHAALHKAGDYENATDAFEAMLSKIERSPDPEIRARHGEYVNPKQTKAAIRASIENAIRESPRELINTDSGHLLDKSAQARSFESQPIFWEMISAMTTHVDHARIEHEVAKYYRYATFSHKWEDDEPLFEKVIHIVLYDLEKSLTHDKLQMFCRVVRRESGFHWAWSDTCCINKADHFVLQEALVSMFKWYEGSAVTIVFLRGVRSPSKRGDLAKSIWNTRAWTLQEYHASKVVRFYTEDWKPYLNLDIPNHKDSPEIISEMEEATGISARALMAIRPGLDDIREKLCLVSRRETTFIEDTAYSLLGIFSSSLHIVYGEGDNALGRLLAQLLTSSGDTSILAWTGISGSFNSCLPANITVFSQLPTTHIPRWT